MSRWFQQPAHLLTAVLAAVCAVLLLGLMLQRMLAGGGVESEVVSVVPGDAERAANLATRSFELPPLEQYAEITQRPLFSEDRRPAPEGESPEGETAEEAVASAEPPPVTLTGVIITPEVRVAMLEHNRRNEQMSLKQGETLDGWTLETVEDRRVVFASGDAEAPVLLEVYTGPAGGGRGAGRQEQAATAAEQSQDQTQSAADMIRERIARERERRRELIEQARQQEQDGDAKKKD